MATGKTNASGGGGAVKYSEAQSLTSAQKFQAIDNIGTMRIYQSVEEIDASFVSGQVTMDDVGYALWDLAENCMAITSTYEFYNNSVVFPTTGIVQIISFGGSSQRAILFDDEARRIYLSYWDDIEQEWTVWRQANSAIKITFSSISSLPQTKNTGQALYVTSTMEVLNITLSNPAAQTGDWTVSTSNGSVTISGTISGTTNIELILGEVIS